MRLLSTGGIEEGAGHRRRLVTSFLVLCPLAAGCGGGDDGVRPDTTPPSITAGPAAAAQGDSVEITWTTNEPANSVVRYSLDLSYGDSETLSPLVLQHEVLLAGLAMDTTYYYVVESSDAAGNGPTASSGASFVTVPTAGQLTAQGWALFESGDFSGAAAAFERAQSAAPTLAEAWSGGGWVALRQGQRDAARSDFESCLALDEQHWDAAAGLAVALASLGEKEESVPWCVEILDTQGDSYEFSHDSEVSSRAIRILLAENYVHLLDFESALAQVRILDPTVDLDPDDPGTWGGFSTFETALLSEIEALA